MPSAFRAAAMDRFLAKVEPEPNSGCWLWIGGHLGEGRYGGFRLRGRMRYAHAAAWLLFRGVIPAGHFVLHRCDVTFCVRPDHLFTGTIADNNRDCRAKGRFTPLRGEANGRARLTAADVVAMRRLHGGGLTHTEIARRYRVHRSTAGYAIAGRRWSHLLEA